LYTQNDIEILTRFIPGLVQKYNVLQNESFKSEQSHLESLLAGLNEIDKRKQAFVKENAPNFNIFNVLRYGHYETRLHTPFLVHLLSTDAHHQLETFFFKLFVDYAFCFNFDSCGLRRIKVYEEFQAVGLEGRIDIHISFFYNSELYLLAIENKINAFDQEDQLSRYYDYLIKQSADPENIRLVYLTKYGDEPSIPYSIDRESYNMLVDKGVLRLLSYKTDISHLISLVLQRHNPIAVNEILKQYLNLINNI